MPYDEKLAGRIREALANQPHVEEKEMFGGICFMVNQKMCICTRDEHIMCRIGPEAYEAALERNGCSPMELGGRTMKGFVFVSREAMKTKKDFDQWIQLSLAFNKEARVYKKKKKG